jgi:hypothetical protein
MSRIPDNLQDAPKNLTIAARNAQKEKERIKASKSRISAIRTKMQPQEALASSTNSRQSSMMSIGTKTKYHYVKSKIDSFNNDDLASSKATYYDQENSRRDSHHSSRKCDSSLYSTETTKIIDGNVESEMLIDELQPIKKKILREKKPTTTVLVKSITSKIKTNLVSSIALSRNHIAQEMTQLPKLKSPTYSKPIRDPNILLASEYEDEIFTHIRSVEREMIPNASYMDLQPSLDWDCRKKLLAWIIQVHSQYKLHQETLFITANLIDRFLSLKQVNTDKLQLAGVTCLLIGSKYEEIMSPTVSDLVYMTDNAYEKEEILVAERFILGVLSFKLCYPHPLNFIRRLSKIDNCSKVVRNLAKYFCQITLLEQGFLGCSSSLIGTAAYYLSIKVVSNGSWVHLGNVDRKAYKGLWISRRRFIELCLWDTGNAQKDNCRLGLQDCLSTICL